MKQENKFRTVILNALHKRSLVILTLVLTLGSLLAFTSLIVDGYVSEADADKEVEHFHGFYPAYATFNQEIKSYMDDLDSISFAFGRVEAGYDGLINMKKGGNGNYDFYQPADYVEVIAYAKEQGKSVQLSLYMDGANAIGLLPYQEGRKELINNIVAILEQEISEGSNLYYDGIVIDFEELKDTDANGKSLRYNNKAMSYYYNTFLKELKTRLSKNMKFYVAVNTDDYYDGYDYNTILKYVDRMIVMAHDFEPRAALKKSEVNQYISNDVLQPIHSLSPIQVIQRGMNRISESLSDQKLMSKVWLQLSFDTAQWQFILKSGGTWTTLSDQAVTTQGRIAPLYRAIKNRVDNTDGKGKNITYGYNNFHQSAYIYYYNTSDNTFNFILYEDSTSLAKKIEVAKAYGLGGISIWGIHNVPNYTDAKGKSYHLDGWSSMVSAMNTYGEVVKGTDTYITFKDKAVEQAVRSYLHKYTGKITNYDMQSIYRIRFSSSVAKLNDLKYMTNLEYINLQGSGITSLSYLAYAKQLKVAYLGNNKISNISGLSKLTKLEKLVLNDNYIKDITPLQNLTKINFLNLGNNKITSVLSLKKLTKVKYLYLQRNSIKNVGALGYMKNIKFLSLNGNLISDVDKLGRMTSLQYLYLTDNKIKDVTPLKNLKNLKELYLKGNSIKSYKSLKTIASKSGFQSDFKVS